jgi:hypothetical protein
VKPGAHFRKVPVLVDSKFVEEKKELAIILKM